MPPERHSEVFGLAAFGLVIWLMIVQSPAWALVLAAASWLAGSRVVPLNN
jgi:hypothetical protein